MLHHAGRIQSNSACTGGNAVKAAVEPLAKTLFCNKAGGDGFHENTSHKTAETLIENRQCTIE